MGLEKHKPLYHRRGIGRALTILEVLVAILLSTLVGIVLYQMFYTQDRTYTIQSDISEMQQNLRVAMEKISRDLTMAGFAQPPWTTINGKSGVDFSGVKVTGGAVIDLVGSFDGTQAVLATEVSSGSTSLELSSGVEDRLNEGNKSDISIGGRESAKITGKSGNTLAIDTDPDTPDNQGLRFAYLPGTEIYLVKWKTYWVDNSDPKQPVLRVNEHLGSGSQQLSLFITGMEIAVAGRMADLTITGRTRNPDRTTGLYTTGQLNNKIFLRNLP